MLRSVHDEVLLEAPRDGAGELAVLMRDVMQGALALDVPLDVVMQRMLDRGREDDTPEAIQRRLDLYEEQTAPLLDHYQVQGLVVEVDGMGTVDEIAARIVEVLA